MSFGCQGCQGREADLQQAVHGIQVLVHHCKTANLLHLNRICPAAENGSACRHKPQAIQADKQTTSCSMLLDRSCSGGGDWQPCRGCSLQVTRLSRARCLRSKVGWRLLQTPMPVRDGLHELICSYACSALCVLQPVPACHLRRGARAGAGSVRVARQRRRYKVQPGYSLAPALSGACHCHVSQGRCA